LDDLITPDDLRPREYRQGTHQRFVHAVAHSR